LRLRINDAEELAPETEEKKRRAIKYFFGIEVNRIVLCVLEDASSLDAVRAILAGLSS